MHNYRHNCLKAHRTSTIVPRTPCRNFTPAVPRTHRHGVDCVGPGHIHLSDPIAVDLPFQDLQEGLSRRVDERVLAALSLVDERVLMSASCRCCQVPQPQSQPGTGRHHVSLPALPATTAMSCPGLPAPLMRHGAWRQRVLDGGDLVRFAARGGSASSRWPCPPVGLDPRCRSPLPQLPCRLAFSSGHRAPARPSTTPWGGGRATCSVLHGNRWEKRNGGMCGWCGRAGERIRIRCGRGGEVNRGAPLPPR
jgi:hypothetical protein